MFSAPLLKRTVKTNGKLWMIFTGILVLQMFLVLSMFTPAAGNGRLFRAIPSEIAAVLGIDMGADALTAYLASHSFAFFYPVISMIYGSIAANRLMAQKVESGTMVYLLASPNKRERIAGTQAVFLAAGLFAMFLCTTAAGLGACAMFLRGKLELVPFLLLNAGGFCLAFCLSGISFLASCISNDTRFSLTIGAGIPTIFLLIRMLANLGGSLEVLKFATMFTLFHTADVLEESLSICWKFPLLAVLGAACYQVGIRQFGKKDLPV
ncbi:ABC transporter permease subunit [Lachnospiraceae bacterium 46-15]